MASYRVSRPAQRDLDDIWDFYERRFGETGADQQLARLQESFQLLADQPYAGVPHPEYESHLRSHVAPRSRYVIFYFPREYGIEVARVIHGSRDIISQFL